MRSTELYGRAFEGSGQSGGGTPPGNGGGGPAGRVTKADLQTDRKKRAAFIDQYGVAAYTALPEK
jgi:hypothetical protein